MMMSLLIRIPEDSVQLPFDIFNFFDVNLKFTLEKEKHRSVPFLDTKLIRTHNNFRLVLKTISLWKWKKLFIISQIIQEIQSTTWL